MEVLEYDQEIVSSDVIWLLQALDKIRHTVELALTNTEI